MPPNTLGSPRWIAGMLLPSVLLLGGCYGPWMQPGYRGGYGNPYYGGNGGYGSPGIPTLTPGPYYAPSGTSVPSTYDPSGIQPIADPANSGGGTNGSGGAGGDGGNAPPSNYNPPATDESPSRPVPFYNGGEGGDTKAPLEPPTSDAPVQENNSGNGVPSVMADPAADSEWSTPQGVEQASGTREAPSGSELTDAPAATEGTETEEAADEEPPLLKP